MQRRKASKQTVTIRRQSSVENQVGEQVQVELSKVPKLSELLCNQFVSKIHWITATCSLITIIYWWTTQFDWYLRVVLSFACNLILHLLISCFYGRYFDQFNHRPITADTRTVNGVDETDSLFENVELGNERPNESRTIKRKEWLNRFLNEIWPRLCSNCKLDKLEHGQPIGRFLFLNKLNLTKTRTPTIEKINLINRLDTSNGQVIILDLIVHLDWSTIDNENLVSLSIYNLQFTISNLHSLATRLRLRIALHYLNKELDKSLYKVTLTLLDLPVIRNYETSGAAYILYFFNLHLTFVYWIIKNFLIFPRTLVFVLNKHVFNLDSLIDKLKDGPLIDLDLDDLTSLSIQNDGMDFFDDLIAEQDVQPVASRASNTSNLNEANKSQDQSKEHPNRSRESDRPEIFKSDNKSVKEYLDQTNEFSKIKLFKDAFSRSLKNKIAKYLLHTSVMYGVNVPLPKGLNSLANVSYFVRVKFGDFKFITNSHSAQEPVLYWMQSFMLALSRLNAPVYLAILVDQVDQANQPEVKKATNLINLTESIGKRAPLEQADRTLFSAKLKECFEIKLTDNFEQFLNSHHINGRLYTVEDEHSKCRLTVRFSVFNLRLPANQRGQSILNETVANETLSISGLPVGVLSLFISHLTGIEFVSNLNKQSLEQFCRLSVRSSSQNHVFRSLNIGNEQHFKQNCFLVIFNPAIERIQFRLYFARHKSGSSSSGGGGKEGQTHDQTDAERPSTQFLTTLTTNQLPADERPSDSSHILKDFQSLASCNLYLTLDKLRPQYEKIKLNGCLKDCYLHVYYCYSEISRSRRLKRIMQDSEQTCHMTSKNLLN